MRRLFTFVTLSVLCTLLGLQGMKAQQSYAVYSGGVLTFYHDTQRNSRSGTKYNLNGVDSYPDWYFDRTSESVKKVVFDASFSNARPTATDGWFASMGSLTAIEGMSDNLNTSEVTDMTGMFAGCEKLASIDVLSFNTSKVTSMAAMFDRCSSLGWLELRNFNTANVTNMQQMFEGCGCESLDLTHFNTAKVTNMSNMFYGCTKLARLDVHSFNTAEVTNMASMFLGTNLSTLDLGSFNTGKVENMQGMFMGSENLNTIYVGKDWRY